MSFGVLGMEPLPSRNSGVALGQAGGLLREVHPAQQGLEAGLGEQSVEL